MDERLDIRLSKEAGITRSRAEKLIRQGHVRVNGAVVSKPGLRVDAAAHIEVEMPAPAPIEAIAQDIPLEICYEDAHIAVVNKPANMVVHPAAGNASGTLVNALLHHLQSLSGIGGMLRPGIVHRLDKDTSGLLLVAKDDASHIALSHALKQREIHKTYLAVSAGTFKTEEGTIDAPIGRHPRDRKRMAVVSRGRDALTRYRVLMPLHGATLLEVDLITGRTHQIRVHFTHIGHPLLGDPIYGGHGRHATAPRLMLHAWRIAFHHPISGAPMSFEAPPPTEFEQTVQKLAIR